MKDTQLAELIELQSLPFEAVKVDCDPRNWNGYGKPPKEMTKEERGRSFDLKNADKSMSIFAKITNIINTHTKPTEGNLKNDEALQRAIDKVKEQAKDLLKQVKERNKPITMSTNEDKKVSFLAFFLLWAKRQGWQVPLIHIKACDRLQHRGDLAVRRCFRGFGKSTILAVYNVWRFYDDPTYRIIHQSETDRTAYKTCRDTRNVLKSHSLT